MFGIDLWIWIAVAVLGAGGWLWFRSRPKGEEPVTAGEIVKKNGKKSAIKRTAKKRKAPTK